MVMRKCIIYNLQIKVKISTDQLREVLETYNQGYAQRHNLLSTNECVRFENAVTDAHKRNAKRARHG